jgi:hypothetical protein
MSDAVVDVENVVKTHEALLKLSALADKYNELINVYKDIISKEIEVELPQLGTIYVEPAKFKELKPLPVPVCIETDKTFNAVHFGKRICLKWSESYTIDVRCYTSKMTVADLIELTCNISRVLENVSRDIEKYVNILPKVIETLKTIVAEAKLLS